MFRFSKNKLQTIMSLLLISFIGATLRFLNISPYKIYPDLYQNLLVAENINHYKNVIGQLGNMGMSYPDFLSWTRPGYALFIVIVSFFTHNEILSAQIISFFSAVFSIPLVYIFLKKIFKKSSIAWCGTLLFTFSFTHIVWTGFYLTEALSVFIVLSIFTIIFSTLSVKKSLGSFSDIVTGFLLGFAVLTRYEYIVLLVPIVIIFFENSIRPVQRLVTIISGFVFSIAVVVSIFFPLQKLINLIALEVPAVSFMLLLSAIGVALFILLYKKVNNNLIKRLSLIFIILLWVVNFYIVILPFIFPFTNTIQGLRSFLLHDFFIQISALIGLIFFIKDPKKNTLFLFVISGLILLGTTYMTINPAMERYMTHLLPFIIIPASYGLYKIFTFAFKNKKSFFILIPLIILQIFISFQGLHILNNGDWFKTSYEEVSAKKTSQILQNKNVILIASFPEPYYFFTRKSTVSITDSSPFIYIDKSLDNRQVIIIEDMGMRDIFPTFSKFIDTQLSQYRLTSFKVGRNYRFAERVVSEKYPVTIYQMPLFLLKQKIDITYSK